LHLGGIRGSLRRPGRHRCGEAVGPGRRHVLGCGRGSGGSRHQSKRSCGCKQLGHDLPHSSRPVGNAGATVTIAVLPWPGYRLAARPAFVGWPRWPLASLASAARDRVCARPAPDHAHQGEEARRSDHDIVRSRAVADADRVNTLLALLRPARQAIDPMRVTRSVWSCRAGACAVQHRAVRDHTQIWLLGMFRFAILVGCRCPARLTGGAGGPLAPCGRNGMVWRLQEARMAKGTVKWFNPTKGYGFIQPQGGGKDVFVHISAVERAGLSTLNEGQVVQYDVVPSRGKEAAENLKVE